ncbi:hypothetical protein J4E86_005442 [Alternaria arbusti]|uniref:uncharacterized protein n=1 Tax=Alternaria arbusti TaxID=232088 RepID=UPI002220D2F7|nr:uncharacterized protein J4E86_005442 [Alternaria arbusti]KAI4956970.1 hypothetical protein J4E86_005442 [Alternaria arbusti]
MKLFNSLAILLIAGIALLTAAAPTVDDGSTDVTPLEYTDVTTAEDCCDWRPTLKHHGAATVEVWVGRPAINGGYYKGEDLKAAVWNMVDHLCPGQRFQCDEPYPGRCVWVDHVTKLNPFPVESQKIGFTNDAYTSPNCYEFPGSMMCNLPDGVRVNLPPLDGAKETHTNYLHVKLMKGGNVQHEFHCCETRDKVDAQLDTLYDRITGMFHEDYGKFRLTNCMVRGWTTCEQCYDRFDPDKCKRCGKGCRKLD